MEVVSISDTHLGSLEGQSGRVREFIETKIQDISPDKFIVAGDMFDLWVGNPRELISESAGIVNAVMSLDSDIVLIGGNHDWALVNQLNDVLPFEVYAEHTFQSGNRDFRVMHGHQFDLLSKHVRNTRLSTKNTTVMGELYQAQMHYGVGALSKGIRRLQNSSFHDKLSRVERRARKYSDEYLIFGHTHTPAMNNDFVNSGDWTELDGALNDDASEPDEKYVYINNGEVELRDY